jgi:3-oxoacyl-[acyl-carrier-protein] synthase-3
LPELPEIPEIRPPRGIAWEFDRGLVDAHGLIARATGVTPSPTDMTASNGAKKTARPGIASISAALPERIVENDEIAEPLGVNSEWIASRTGVRRRRRVDGESLVELSVEAGARALELANVAPAEIDLVLVATFTPDAVLPNAAPLVAKELGTDSAGAVDLGAACTGFLSGLSLAAGQIETGRARSVLVVGADLLSRVIDYGDKRTAGLFGDGAGAALLTAGSAGEIGPMSLRSDGGLADLIKIAHEDRLIRMDGRPTFRAAVAGMSSVTQEVASDAGVSIDEIDLFVYHQANSRILSAVGERLQLPPERVVDCIAEYGNTSAASIPIALAEAARDGRLRPGSRVMLGAFGAGLTWGAGIIEWEGAA